jgi:5'-nucleotidase/UDP-sugar diphosphatase
MPKIILILITLFFFACDNYNGNDNSTNTSVIDTLVVLHTNDHHGAIDGLARRATIFDNLKKQHGNILVLDAGDMNTGSVLSNIFKARPDILAYNLLGYDAVVLGNHEFDNSPEILQKQIVSANFKFISANIEEFTPFIIKNFGKLSVAVIGITTRETLQNTVFGKEFTFQSEIETARKFIDIVQKENPNLIIFLTHLGIDESKILADSVSGIDLIIDGHSHTKLENPVFVNGIPIVSAFEHGKEIGQAKFIFEDGKITNFTWQKTIIDENIAENQEMINLIKPFADSLQKSMSEVIAETTEEFPFLDESGNRLPRMGESAIGNLVIDAIMNSVEADFVLINGGTIRAGLKKGKITREDVLAVLPFENFVEIVKLSGKDVLELFNFIATIQQGNGAFAQISKNLPDIEPEKIYFVATNDFLSSGGDGYSIFENKEKIKTGKLLSDVLIEYLRNKAVK